MTLADRARSEGLSEAEVRAHLKACVRAVTLARIALEDEQAAAKRVCPTCKRHFVRDEFKGSYCDDCRRDYAREYMRPYMRALRAAKRAA